MSKTFIVLTISIMMICGFTTMKVFSEGNSEQKKHKVVIQVQVDGEDKWNEVLGNIENLNKAFGAENLDVVVVAHGKALGLVLPQSSCHERLEKLSALGIQFKTCQNTLNKTKTAQSDLLPFVSVVDAGVAEVVRRQEQGYVYLKAGS